MNGLIFGVIALLTLVVVALSIKVFEQKSMIRRLKTDLDRYVEMVRKAANK